MPRPSPTPTSLRPPFGFDGCGGAHETIERLVGIELVALEVRMKAGLLFRRCQQVQLQPLGRRAVRANRVDDADDAGPVDAVGADDDVDIPGAGTRGATPGAALFEARLGRHDRSLPLLRP